VAEVAPSVEASAEVAPGGAKHKNDRSTIQFPYGDLKQAVGVVKAIYGKGGTEGTPAQVAAWMSQSVSSGAFRANLSTARIFGLIDVGRERIKLTPLGQQFNDPKRERQVRVAAFLKVPLYKALFVKFDGHPLPVDVAIENEMIRLGVAAKQADKARQAFQRSAEQAGFFELGKDRLVLPAGTTPLDNSGPGADPETGDSEHGAQPPNGRTHPDAGGGGGGGIGNPPKRHPAIEGLLDELPPRGVEWADTDLDDWVTTFKGVLRVIYKIRAKRT
jgi:hypothetical protein